MLGIHRRGKQTENNNSNKANCEIEEMNKIIILTSDTPESSGSKCFLCGDDWQHPDPPIQRLLT